MLKQGTDYIIRIGLITVFLFLSNLEASEKKSVFMVLWRGKTEAEKGFIHYLNSSMDNVEYTVRNCGKDKEKIKGFMEEIKRKKPDLVYTFGTTVTSRIAGTYSDTGSSIDPIPVVFNIVAYPVMSDIVDSTGFSGRNVTGASHIVPMQAQLNAVRKMIDYKKIALFYNGVENNSVIQKKKMLDLAQKNSFAVSCFDIEDTLISRDIENFLDRCKPDVIYLPSDSYLISSASEFLDITDKFNVPVFSATEEPVRENGALFGLVSRYYNVGQLAGHKAHTILSGERNASEIRVDNLKRFSFIVNISTAKKRGLTPPLSVMTFAEIVE